MLASTPPLWQHLALHFSMGAESAKMDNLLVNRSHRLTSVGCSIASLVTHRN